MPSDFKPLLVFPNPTRSTRSGKPSPRSPLHAPTRERQLERLASSWENLLQRSSIEVSNLPGAPYQDNFLVLELATTPADFAIACSTLGIETILEIEDPELLSDEEFFYLSEDGVSKIPVTKSVFLWGLNHRELTQLVKHFKAWAKDGKKALPTGLKKLDLLFSHLKSVRFWSVEDRLSETRVLEYWSERIREGAEEIEVEVELWYSSSDVVRSARFDSVRDAIQHEGGRLITELCEIPEIAYSGFAAILPINSLTAICQHPSSELVAANSFIHQKEIRSVAAAGQSVSRIEPGEVASEAIPEKARPSGDPLVALLDGLPLAAHKLLANRLHLDDPDEWEATYPSQHRLHGTAMASIIIHGEARATDAPISRPLYVRPITKPSALGLEVMPTNPLPIALFKSAVKRIAETAPSVRVVVVSLGDEYRPFYGKMSAWARLIDYLSQRYGLLFLVSAGNHVPDLDLAIDVNNASTQQIAAEVLRHRILSARHSPLLSPAESINALTIGATNDDSSDASTSHLLIDLLAGQSMPSLITPITSGFRRATKPELFARGGRLLHKRPLLSSGTVFRPITSPQARPPGYRVASPAGGSADLNGFRYITGTSVANAEAGRSAHLILEALEKLDFITNRGGSVDPKNLSVILKALLVHSASWSSHRTNIAELIKAAGVPGDLRSHLSRILGYGVIDVERATQCSSSRVTIFGTGYLAIDEAHLYKLPLPVSYGAAPGYKRLELTTAWLTPISPSSARYRNIALEHRLVEDPTRMTRGSTAEVKHFESRRGTVQRTVFESERMTATARDADIEFTVSCRADVPHYRGSVRYAVVATLDAPEVAVDLYEEVKTRLSIRVPALPAIGS